MTTRVFRIPIASSGGVRKEQPKPTVDVEKISMFNDFSDIAAFTQDYGNKYSGGRYYTMLLYHQLAELKRDICVYSQRTPIYIGDFNLYNQPRFRYFGKANNVLVPHANIYIGDQAMGANLALINGSLYNKPTILILFDSPQWLIESDHIRETGTLEGELSRHNLIKNALNYSINSIPKLKIIVLTENSIPSFANWYGISAEHFTAIAPCVNDRKLDIVKKPKRSNQIIGINRNNSRKNWKDFFILSKYIIDKYDSQIHIITKYDDTLNELVNEYNIPKNKLTVHENISDFHKYRLIMSSWCLLSTSKFEGFGMWTIDGIMCGTPVCCFDLQSLQEINSNMLYRGSSIDELKDKLDIIKNRENYIIDIDYSSQQQRDKLSSLLKELL